MNTPNDLPAILRHLRETEPPVGGIVHLEVRHDASCAHWDGWPCDCEPEIETGQRVQRKYGGER